MDPSVQKLRTTQGAMYTSFPNLKQPHKVTITASIVLVHLWVHGFKEGYTTN